MLKKTAMMAKTTSRYPTFADLARWRNPQS